jgi:hypothetical protein
MDDFFGGRDCVLTNERKRKKKREKVRTATATRQAAIASSNRIEADSNFYLKKIKITKRLTHAVHQVARSNNI